MAEKVMPHSLDAEQGVLCSMFLTDYALRTALENLSVELFYADAHKKIFEVIRDLSDRSIKVDVTTVTAELENKQYLEAIGGVEYLAELINYLPSAANVDEYIKIVNEKAILRRLIDTATNIVTNSYDPRIQINEVLDDAEKKILNVVKTRQGTEFKSIQEVLTSTQAYLEQLAKNQGKLTGIPSGYERLDKLTTGFHPNELIIIGARPAVGKTAFALNLATNMARAIDKTVVLFNMEMDAKQLVMRMLSSVGRIEGEHLKNGDLANDWPKINQAMAQLADTKMVIDDTAGMTVGEIRSKCRRLASSPDGLGIVIIDYLGLIQGSARYAGNRQQEVSEISRSLKTMAMELEVPVIALAQLSRGVEGRDEKRPMLSDLRESGSIEQDADIVAFLYRDDYYGTQGIQTPSNPYKKVVKQPSSPKQEESKDKNLSKTELIIAKHRNGATDTIDFMFTKNYSRFDEMEKKDE